MFCVAAAVAVAVVCVCVCVCVCVYVCIYGRVPFPVTLGHVEDVAVGQSNRNSD